MYDFARMNRSLIWRLGENEEKTQPLGIGVLEKLRDTNTRLADLMGSLGFSNRDLEDLEEWVEQDDDNARISEFNTIQVEAKILSR